MKAQRVAYPQSIGCYMTHDVQEDVGEDPSVKRFVSAEMAHILKSPVLRELVEKLALKYGIDPKTARASILKAIKLETGKVK